MVDASVTQMPPGSHLAPRSRKTRHQTTLILPSAKPSHTMGAGCWHRVSLSQGHFHLGDLPVSNIIAALE